MATSEVQPIVEKSYREQVDKMIEMELANMRVLMGKKEGKKKKKKGKKKKGKKKKGKSDVPKWAQKHLKTAEPQNILVELI